jgi:hypothetical protein
MGTICTFQKRIGIFVGLAAVAVWCTGAFGQGNLHLGRLTVTPGVQYELRYDDNVFFAATDEQDDIVHILTPSIFFGYAGALPETFLQFGYLGDFAYHADLEENDWTRHRPFISAGYGSPAGFYARASDNYTWSEDPFGTFNELEQNTQFGLGEKTKRYDNLANLLLGYRFATRWYAEGYYSNYIIRYDQLEDEWQDRSDNVLGALLGFRLTPKTSLLAEYRTAIADYDEQNDGVFDAGRGVSWSEDTSQDYVDSNVWVGFRFEPGGKISGEAKVGWGWREWENSVDALGFEYVDDGTVTASTSVFYAPTARTNLTLNLFRTFLGSPDADASSFINTLVQLRLRQELGYKLILNGLASFNNDDYQNVAPGRPDKYFNRYILSAGLDWAIRPWLTIGGFYQFENQSVSDAAAYGTSEYERNVLAAQVKIVY